jgi:hypothetical protein
LAEHYKNYKEAGKPLELIFSTGDQSKEDFEMYRKEMQEKGGDWLAIPFDEEEIRDDLDTLFEVRGIPKLVIVEEDGTIINDNAVQSIKSDATGANFPWAPPAVGDLASPEGIDESASIAVFMEEVEAASREAIMAQLEEIAKMYILEAKAKNEDPKYRFFVAKSGDGAVPQIRRMASVVETVSPPTEAKKRPQLQKRGSVETMENPDAEALVKGSKHVPMILLDFMDNGAYYNFDGSEITAATISDFIQKYETKTLKREQLTKG